MYEKRVCWFGKTEKSLPDTVKPVLSGHSKVEKTKVLKTICSLMKVKSIEECSLNALLEHSAILLICIKR